MRRDRLLQASLAVWLVAALASRGGILRRPELYRPGALALLAALLAASRSLELSGAPERVARRLLQGRRGLARLTLASALLAAASMNDSAAFIMGPLAASYSRICGVGPGLAAAFVAAGVNLGSMASPVGNPQNIIIWRSMGVSPLRFALDMLPLEAATVGALLAAALLVARGECGRRAPAAPPVAVDTRRALAGSALILADTLLGAAGRDYAALALTLLVLLMVDRRSLLALDAGFLASVPLLVGGLGYLSGLFSSLPLPREGAGLALAAALASQAVSNLPATLLLLPHAGDWRGLAAGVDIGGLGTAWASLANLIVLRLSGAPQGEYHRWSLALLLLGLAAGLPLLLTG